MTVASGDAPDARRVDTRAHLYARDQSKASAESRVRPDTAKEY